MRLALASAGVVAALPGRGIAQPETSSGVPDSAWLAAVVAELEPNDLLRIQRTGSPSRFEGRYLGLEDVTLSLSTEEGVIGAPLGEISLLWTRGRSTGKGALIGGIAGLVIGAVYGAAISEVTCAESACTTVGVMAAIGGIGAAGGAGLGALVGLAIPRWKLRFP